MNKLRVMDLNTMDYGSAVNMMRAVRDDVEHGGDDALLLVEHKPVITIGKDGDETSIIDKGYINKHNIPLVYSDRGGDAVVHNTGQLVAYPVMKVSENPLDIVNAMWDVLAYLISDYGLVVKNGKEPGAWVLDQKLGFIGMKVQGGVSIHGIAINVANDLDPFNAIKTCGVQGEKVTSLTLAAKKFISVDDVKRRLISKFSRRFDYLPDKFIIEENSEPVI